MLVLLACLALSALGPGLARASTVNVSGCHAINGGSCINQHFTYTAAAGEVNDLTISTHSTGTFSSTYDVEDPGAVIVLPPGMTENPPGPEDPTCNQISDHHVRCSALGNLTSDAHTTVRLGDMNDEARVTPHVSTEIFGDAGNDSISASGHLDDMHGGDGDDTVVTTDDASDDLFGDGGDDVLRTSQPLDRTEADGGIGNDTFDFSNRSGNVSAIANNTDSGAGNTYPGIENFIGGAGDDTLTGDAGPNSLAGGAGDDTLSGLGGDDTFDPGPGPIQSGPVLFSDDDAVNGGDGAGDLVTYEARSANLVIDADGVADDGASGEDDNVGTTVENIHGGTGDDELTGNASSNVLNGWTGADVLDGLGGAGDVASYEGRAADLVLNLDGVANDGTPANGGTPAEGDRIRLSIENIWGGRGDDDITGSNFFFNMSGGSTGINELRGGFGDDHIDGLGQNDILRGNGTTELVLASDDDRLDGGEGNDILDGDTANAVFFDPEPDDLIGGDGIDLADYSARSIGVTVDIPEPPPNPFLPPPAANDGQAGEGDRVYSSIENVDGGGGSDTITGSSGVNVLNGGSGGSDTLNGLGAGDTLNGGNEAGTAAPGDTLNGGDGTDALNGGDDNDVLNGGTLADALNGGADRDTLNGDAGGDTLNGDAGQDQLNGGADGDALNAGGGTLETLNGDAGADSLSTGTSQGSTLNGGDDTDTISSVGASGTGVMQLSGGAGADTLIPGTAGRDVVAGGDGTDVVSYAGRAAAVTVTIGTNAFDDGQAGIPNGDDRVEADVENVTGGPAGDSLIGTAGANTLDGGAGPDTLVGGEGADMLLGGTEDDHLKSRDASADQDDCGAGAADKVTYDSQDTRTGCERAAPNQTAPPTVSGTARDGQTLDANPGTWEGEAPIAFAYRWRRCDADGVSNCSDIAGTSADDQSYSATPEDVGHTLRVRVTASNGVDSAEAEASSSAEVLADPPANTAAPTIAGTLRDAETVTADPGTWSGTPPLAFAYQWRSCDAQNDADCTDIAGATASSFQITSAEVGRRLRVRTTATNATGPGQAATEDSTASEVVAPAPPANTSAPTVTGETQSGQTVTASAGSWSGTPPLSYAYQWRSCNADSGDCVDIAGATGETFVLSSADVARRVSVRVTATNDGGSASAESAQSLVVTAAGGEPGGGGGPPGGGGGPPAGGGGPPAGGGGPPSNNFSIDRALIAPSNGRATITVNVPGPGILALTASSPPSAVGPARAEEAHHRKPHPPQRDEGGPRQAGHQAVAKGDEDPQAKAQAEDRGEGVLHAFGRDAEQSQADAHAAAATALTA